MDEASLSAVFLAELPQRWREQLDPTELERRLQDAVREAQRAWPELHVDERAFVAHAAALAGREGDPSNWLDQLRVEDLWLAFACSTGDAAAIAAFERVFADDIRRIIGRFGRSAEQRDDLMQILRGKLFVGTTEGSPKLLGYAGIGFLQNWLRVTATRTFVDLTRAKKTPSANTPLDLALASGSDVELDFLKERYRDAFKLAFAEATEELEPAERNVLRRRLEGLNVDQLAALEGVHRSTAARRLAKARHSLLQRTRAKLGERLEVGQSELDSVMNLFQSRLDVSLERLLETRAGTSE